MPSFLRLSHYIVLFVFMPMTVFAQTNFEKAPLGADDVFRLSVLREADGMLRFRFAIADGNYLYRDSIAAKLGGETLLLQTPPGELKEDPNFGEVEIYHRTLDVTARPPLTGSLTITYRGCAEAGICYPPRAKSVDLATLTVRPDRAVPEPKAVANPTGPVAMPANGDATTSLAGRVSTIAVAFLGFGILLAFTPCAFPMIPILSAMLAGSGKRLTALRSFALSSAYVIAMAAAYGLVGLYAGFSGANLQLVLQTPWALGLSAAIFVVLALSMFGVFTLSLPSALASRMSGRVGGGSIAGAAALGFSSALIVSPCVTPPLAAAILYSVQSGDAGRGAIALFFLGLGMGLPLIVFGTLGPRFLPKSGAWLERVRSAFGFVLLGVAMMLVTRLVPESTAMAMWGVLAIGFGVFVGAFYRMDAASTRTGWLSKSVGLIAALYGAILVVGYVGGGRDPLRPLTFPTSSSWSLQPTPIAESRITSPEAFDSAVARLGQGGKPILVSFTADWCTVCKSNEAILARPTVGKLRTGIPVIVVDVTAQSGSEQALMRRFGIVGPPTMFVLNRQGVERPGSRLVGPITVEEISQRLTDAGA